MKLARPPWLPITEYVDMIDRGKLTEKEAIRAGRSIVQQHPEFANALIDQYVAAELRDQQRITPQPQPEPEPEITPPAVDSADPPARTARFVPPLPPRKTDEQLVLELFPSLPYRVPVAVGAKRPVLQLDKHGVEMMSNMLVNQYSHARDEGIAKAAEKWEAKIQEVREFRHVFLPIMHDDETVQDVIARIGPAKIGQFAASERS